MLMRQEFRPATTRWATRRRGRLGGPHLRIVLVALSLAAPAGCTMLPEPAVRQIRSAHEAYKARQFDRAARMLSPVIRKHPDTPEIAEALYLRGLCNVRLRRRAAARTDLEKALLRSQRPDLTAFIRAQLGNLAFDQGKYTQAAALYAQAEDNLPPRAPTDQILYQYGLSLQRSGRFTDARFAFARVFTEFPTRPYAGPARRKYKWGHKYFTVQCGAFTKIQSARELANELKQQGFKARIIREVRDGAGLYVVQAGKYRTYAKAVTAAHGMRGVVHDVFIVP